MFGNDVISSDYWRNYIPFAPDLTATVVVGKTVEISLKEHLIQGARDYAEKYSPDPTILPELVLTQRGWLLDIMQTNNGKFGIAELSKFRDGFEYTPLSSSPSTFDCFNYQLSNGTQLSNYGQINIEVIQPIITDWKIFSPSADVYLPNQTQGEYSMSFDVSVGHSSFFMSPLYRVIWHIFEPTAKLDDDGVTRVYLKETKIERTSITTNYYHDIIVVNTGKTLPKRLFKTDKDVVGIDPATNAPYIPTNKFPKVQVRYINYPHRIPPGSYYDRYDHGWDTRRPEVFLFDIEDTFGKVWNRSGLIKLTGQK